MRGIAVVLGVLWAFGGVAQAAKIELSAKDYRLYVGWTQGKEDPRLEKLSEVKKKRKIARSLGVSLKELDAAVSVVGPVAATLPAKIESAVAEQLAKTSLKGRIKTVEISPVDDAIVAGIKWSCGDVRDHDKEAVYVAWAFSEAAPVVKTLALWCVDGSDTKQFSGVIDNTGYTRIRESGIERFASSRYIKMFTDVKRGAHR